MKISLFFAVGLLSLIISCNDESNDKSSMQVPSSDSDEFVWVKTHKISFSNELILLKPEKISLSYKLDKNYIYTSLGKLGKLDPESSQLNCVLTNNNKQSVFLVGYTCADLPGVLKVEPLGEFYDWQSTYCNMSYPFVQEIKPNDSIKFSTNLRAKGNSKIKSLGLYVKFVDRFMEARILKQNPALIKTVIYTPYEECSFIKSDNIIN